MDEHDKEIEQIGRVTAPQQEYSMRQVGLGFVVLLVGLVVAFGVPLLL